MNGRIAQKRGPEMSQAGVSRPYPLSAAFSAIKRIVLMKTLSAWGLALTLSALPAFALAGEACACKSDACGCAACDCAESCGCEKSSNDSCDHKREKKKNCDCH